MEQKNIEINLTVTLDIFNDGSVIIANNKALDISGYGYTVEEAIESFKEVLKQASVNFELMDSTGS